MMVLGVQDLNNMIEKAHSHVLKYNFLYDDLHHLV